MSGTTGGGVTVPTVPVPIGMGGTGSTTASDAISALGASVPPTVTTFTGNGTFTKKSTSTVIQVLVVGGGGGGGFGGSYNPGATGGSGGGGGRRALG